MFDLKVWLKSIIIGCVLFPDDVKIEEKKDEMGILFTIIVHPNDCGRIIGKEGKHADALRVLLRNAGTIRDIRASLKIVLPDRLNNFNKQ